MIVFDLDDTLYKERDYCRSAFAAIVREMCLPEGSYQAMADAQARGLNPYDELVNHLGRKPSFDQWLSIYRYHQPDISLTSDAVALLEALSDKKENLALITDGRKVTQRNKIRALGLDRYIPQDNVYISEEQGADKSSDHSFRQLMRRFPDDSFVYIGDNTQKDVMHPCSLGWKVYILKDTEGINIHRQTPQDWKINPKYTLVTDLKMLIELL